MKAIDLFYIGEEKVKKYFKNMINLLAENNIWHDLYKIYVNSGGTLEYKDWLACHDGKQIQKEAIRLGYKGEIINFN